MSLQKEEEPSVGVTFDFSRTNSPHGKKGREGGREAGAGTMRDFSVAVALQSQGEAMAPY